MNNIIEYILYYILNICSIIYVDFLRFFSIFKMLRLFRFLMLRFCFGFHCYDVVTIFLCYDFVTKVDVIFQKVTIFVTKSRRFCYEKSTFSRRFVTISIKHVTKSRRIVDEKSTFCDDCYDIFHQCTSTSKITRVQTPSKLRPGHFKLIQKSFQMHSKRIPN